MTNLPGVRPVSVVKEHRLIESTTMGDKVVAVFLRHGRGCSSIPQLLDALPPNTVDKAIEIAFDGTPPDTSICNTSPLTAAAEEYLTSVIV